MSNRKGLWGFIGGIFVIAALASGGGHSTTKPMTQEERVVAAVEHQKGCTPQPQFIRSAGSDSTGTVYFAACNSTVWMVFINPQDEIKVKYAAEWNGR